MANTAQIVAGSRILASLIQAIAPLAIIKAADQPLTSDTTLQDDTALLLPVAAGATYLMLCYLDFDGGALGSSDIKWTWSVPALAAMRYGVIKTTTAGVASPSNTVTDSTVVTAGTNGAGVPQAAIMIGTLVTAGTAGNAQLRWAQNTSSVTPTIVRAQSCLALWRVT